MYYLNGMGEKKKKEAPTAKSAAKSAEAARDQALQIQAQTKHDQIPKWVWYAGAGVGVLLVIAMMRK